MNRAMLSAQVCSAPFSTRHGAQETDLHGLPQWASLSSSFHLGLDNGRHQPETRRERGRRDWLGSFFPVAPSSHCRREGTSLVAASLKLQLSPSSDKLAGFRVGVNTIFLTFQKVLHHRQLVSLNSVCRVMNKPSPLECAGSSHASVCDRNPVVWAQFWGRALLACCFSQYSQGGVECAG